MSLLYTSKSALMTDYDPFAHTFSQSRKSLHWPEVDAILADLREKNYASVLDVGCGNGRFLEFAKKAGFQFKKYHGIDNSSGMIREAENLHPSEHFTICAMENIENCTEIR